MSSCNQEQHPDYLSSWFIRNEDSLYADFNRVVEINQIDKTPDTFPDGSIMSLRIPIKYTDSNTYLQEFTKQVKKSSDKLIVKFYYGQSDTPHARILISTGYKKSLTEALDNISILYQTPNILH